MTALDVPPRSELDGVAFRAKLRDERTAALFDHWRALAHAASCAAGAPRAPRRADLDAAAFASCLRFIWLVDYAPEDDRFTYRLAGEHVREVLGRQIKGRPLQEVISDQSGAARAHDRFRAVLETPAALLVTGEVYQAADLPYFGQRLVLPLAEDSGGPARTILGLTIPEIHGSIGEDVFIAAHLLAPIETLVR